MAEIRAFIYCKDANTAYANAIMNDYAIVPQIADALQDGITEYSFTADEQIVLKVQQRIFHGNVPLHFSKDKMAITGNVGSIAVSTTAPSSIVSDTMTVSTSAVAFTDATAQELTVRNDPDSADSIYVGNSSAQSFQLDPGEATPPIKIDNANKIYVKKLSTLGTTTAFLIGSG